MKLQMFIKASMTSTSRWIGRKWGRVVATVIAGACASLLIQEAAEAQKQTTVRPAPQLPQQVRAPKLPTWDMIEPGKISPEDAEALRQARRSWKAPQSHAATGAQPQLQALTASFEPVQGPASIVELARALKNDPDLIYKYVYENIEYTPTYGSKKGPLGTIIDGQGNAFDQAGLMAALLQQAGYTTTIVVGRIRLPRATVAAFFGVAANDTIIDLVIARGGLFGGSLGNGFTDFDHAWVKVNIGGTDYVFDPALKTYTTKAQIDLATAMGYSRSTLLANATSGATTDPNFIQNVNRTGLRNTLAGYANTLVTYLRSQKPDAALDDIIGGRSIVPLSDTPLRQTSHPYFQTSLWEGSAYTSNYRAQLHVQLMNINQSFFADEISSKRLTIFFNGSNQPVLYLDGSAIATGSAGTPGAGQNITIGIDQAYPLFGASYGDQTGTISIKVGDAIAIVNGWDMTGRGMIEHHRKRLQESRAAGSADSSEAVLGQTLMTMGATWNAQLGRTSRIVDRIADTLTVMHHLVGVVRHGAGPVIDIPFGFGGTTSRNVDTNDARRLAAFFTKAGMGSALEFGVIEQTLPIGGVSTVKLFDIANNQGDKFFDATSANYNSSVRPNLLNYSAGDLTSIDAAVAEGKRLILPEHGNLTEGISTGAGYLAITADQQSLSYAITGNLKGGNYTAPVSTPVFTQTYFSVETVANPLNSVYIPPASLTFDPINFVTGDFLYSRDDLSVGQGSFPFSLGFQRSYNSGSRLRAGVMGLGWSHSFDITSKPSSEGFQGLGEDSPVDAAAAIVGIYASFDLLGDVNKPLARLVIATLAHRWWMDQLINNVMTVLIPGGAREFVRLADGSYNPPLESADSLVKAVDGSSTFTAKDGVKMEFNTSGNVTSWKNPNNVTATFTYSGDKLQSVTNGLGGTLTFAYTNDRVTQVSDGVGRSVSYQYDGAGNLTGHTDATGKVTTYAYDAPGRLQKIFYPSFPAAAFVTNEYDSLGRVKTQTNANSQTYQYFFAGFRSEEKDPLGNSRLEFYNPRGKILKSVNNLGQVTTNEYDGIDRLIKSTMPEGNSVEYVYDAKHNPLTVTAKPKPGSPLSPIVQQFSYEPNFSKVATTTDALGRVTTYAYDSSSPPKGNLLSITYPTVAAGTAVRSFTYNARGQVLTETDPVGTVTQYTYDPANTRLQSVVADFGTNKLNLTTYFGTDWVGNVNLVQDPRGNVTTTTYDAMRRVTQVILPVLTGQSGSHVVQTTYDSDGRVIETKRSTGNVLAPWVIASTTYSVSGQRLTSTDPRGYSTSYEYDELDRLKKTTDPELRVTSVQYDVLGRTARIIDPLMQTVGERTYTANGKLVTLKDARQKTTTYEYDGFDRLAKMTYPDSSFETFTYDAVGNVLTRTTRAGQTVAFAYDALNRVTTKTPPSPTAIVSYAYDLGGRITAVNDNSAAIPILSSSINAIFIKTYQYDQRNRSTTIGWDQVTTPVAPSASTVTFGHTYNKVNQRTAQSVTDNTYLQYPAAVASTISYGAANDVNQYPTVGGATLTYDANGNLTGDGTNTYTYDAERRMVAATSPGNTISYAYDSRGRRKSKTVNGVTTLYVTDINDNEVLEYDGATGGIVRRIEFGLGVDQPLDVVTAAGVRTQTLADIQGSIVAQIDGSGGSVTRFGYLPFGESASSAGAYRYAARRLDAETGLYYYRRRHYSPILGRFVQNDPAGYEAGANLYAYVANNPLNMADPTGLWSVDVNLGIVGGSIGVGEKSGQFFWAVRGGSVGAGVTYDPSTDIPMGKSGNYPGDCLHCTVASSYWETIRKGSAGLTVGPVNVSILQREGRTLVNEYNKSGNLVSSFETPDRPAEFDPSISVSGEKKFGIGIEVNYYREIGGTIPWQNIREFLGVNSPSSSISPGGISPAAFSNSSSPAPVTGTPPSQSGK